ncbi:MAG TPA: toll/interleukin-1 receptor domain-containing protein [Pirellulaceae bacterium]|nr:toll/interleukin-1 receptor domain-containing protein [Pirellulaceae bacterium]
MIATASESFDVFLSHSLVGQNDAHRVAQALTDAGMNVFDSTAVAAGGSTADEIWNAMAVSDAFVVVADPRIAPSANVQVELGAAMGWNKPIFVVRTDEAVAAKSVDYLRKFPTFPETRLVDLVAAIRTTAAPLSNSDRQALADAYQELGAPVDRLIADPELADDLSSGFRGRSLTRLSGERLLQELLRMRKAGILPRLKRRG